MIISDTLQKRLDKVEEMGIQELKHFRAEIINSLLDNQTKFYAYDVIDNRIKNLSLHDAVIVLDDIELEQVEI